MKPFEPFEANKKAIKSAIQATQSISALSAVKNIEKLSAFNSDAFKFETSGALAAIKELQKALNSYQSPINEIKTFVEEYSKITAPILESIKAINLSFAPIIEQTRAFDTANLNGIVAGLQSSVSAMKTMSELNLKGFAGIIDSLPKYDFLSDIVSDDFSIADAEELYESGEITQDDINEEFSEIVRKKQFMPKAEWDKIKKSKWFLAIKILIFIITFLGQPLIEHTGDNVRDFLGITQFIEDYDLHNVIDSFFESFEDEKETVTEEEAKETVDKSNIGNISKQKRDDLLNKIQEIRTYISTAEQDENTARLLTYLSDLAKDINGKKYGLVFEEHREEIDEVLDTHTPVLTEDTDLFIDNGGQMNFLIEGDNLASLKLLEKTHKGKIDLIYIDPPYNTGKEDFIYDDKYIVNDDGYKHSKWISFISKRLFLARSLLNEKGAIFIQISDIELAQLRLICDSIFGEKNFLNIISVNMKNVAGASGGGEDKRFKKNCEYILVYAKNYDTLPIFNGAYELSRMSELVRQYKDEGKSWKYNSVLVDKGQKEYIDSTVDGDGNEIRIYKRIGLKAISIKQYAKQNNISEDDVFDFHSDIVFRTTMPQSSIRPRVIKKMKELNRAEDVISIEYIPKTGRNKGKVYEQFYSGDKYNLFAWLSDVTEIVNGVAYKKDLQGTYWDYTAGTKNLTKEGNVEFENGKKPVDLLKRIISLYPRNDITIIDFFAGSASTGHAVIDLNIDDNGSRSFILCNNNQNNICREKAFVRLSNVINGYKTTNGKLFASKPASLKYYKVEYVPISERMYYEYADELLLHIRELVELENGINFIGNAEIAILLTDEDLEDFIRNIGKHKKCKKIYVGHDVLFDAEQAQVLKSKKISVNIIPDYYYKELEG